MSIKFYKPTGNGRRNMSVTDYSELSNVAPERSLLVSLKKNSGRNSYGRITRPSSRRRSEKKVPYNRLQER